MHSQIWEYFEPIYQSTVTAYVANLTGDGSTEQLFLTRFVGARVQVRHAASHLFLCHAGANYFDQVMEVCNFVWVSVIGLLCCFRNCRLITETFLLR